MSEFPGTWDRLPLMDVVTLHDSQRVPLNHTERAARKGPFPYYGANGQVDLVDDYLFDGDYVLLAEDGGYFDDPMRGVAYEATGRFWVNNHAHILSPGPRILQRFLTYALNHQDWMPYVGGSTRLKLTQEGMRRVQIPIPPLDQQRKIVASLDGLSGRTKCALEALDHLPKLIERYKQSILAKAMNTDEEGRDWPRMPLEELVTEGPTNGYSPRSGDNPNGTLSLKLTATTRGVLDLSDRAVKRLNEVIEPNSKYWLRSGDILIQRANSLDYVGVAAIYEGPSATYIYPDLMIRIRVASPALGRWIWRYCSSGDARRYFVDNATGTAGNMPKISGSTIRKMLIPVPPPDRLEEVLNRIDRALDSVSATQRVSIQAYKLLGRLDRSILESAFRGELSGSRPAGGTLGREAAE